MVEPLQMDAPKTYSLTEISKLTGISMPTLLRYKRDHLDRLPHLGDGKSMQFYSPAIAAVSNIKSENIRKRGNRRKRVEA